MPFELRITVTGLSLFLPGPAGEPPRMHVLLPKCHPKHVEHFPRVWYDKAYTNNNPTDLPDPHRKREEAKLPERADFGDLNVLGGTVEHLPDSVPCLSCATRRNFDLATVRNVASHLVLPPGRPALTDALSVWSWLGVNQRLTGQVLWQVQVKEGNLKAMGSVPALYPKDDVIELFISNQVKEAAKFPPPISGPKPELDKPMPHFGAYYDLYETDMDPVEQKHPIYKGLIAASAPYSCLSSGGH